MGTGKERIRRWRERNKADGRKSVTIVLSKRAHQVLSAEKERTGDNYGAIVERALLNTRRRTNLLDNVTSNEKIVPVTVTPKKLVDEGDYHDDTIHPLTRDGGILFGSQDTLEKGFLTRLLKNSKRKLFKS